MKRHAPKVLGLSAEKAAVIYLLFGVTWITTTDWLVIQLAATESQVAWLQAIKGWVFVGLSTVLIFGLVHFREKQILIATDRLTVALEQLQVIHRVFRHNLRNELTVFRGYVKTVASSLQDEDLRQQLGFAENAASRINHLNEVLRKVENPHNPVDHPVDLVRILQTERDRIEETGENVEMCAPDEAYMLGDESVNLLVREIFEYLAKLQRESDGCAEIDVDLSPRHEELILSVGSPGRYIPKGEIEPLRAGEEEPLFHASGVELWVMKWLANYFGGDLEIESADEYNHITVKFPQLSQLDQYAISARKQIDDLVAQAEA